MARHLHIYLSNKPSLSIYPGAILFDEWDKSEDLSKASSKYPKYAKSTEFAVAKKGKLWVMRT